jgi:hypothetical protein
LAFVSNAPTDKAPIYEDMGWASALPFWHKTDESGTAGGFAIFMCVVVSLSQKTVCGENERLGMTLAFVASAPPERLPIVAKLQFRQATRCPTAIQKHTEYFSREIGQK